MRHHYSNMIMTTRWRRYVCPFFSKRPMANWNCQVAACSLHCVTNISHPLTAEPFTVMALLFSKDLSYCRERFAEVVERARRAATVARKLHMMQLRHTREPV